MPVSPALLPVQRRYSIASAVVARARLYPTCVHVSAVTAYVVDVAVCTVAKLSSACEREILRLPVVISILAANTRLSDAVLRSLENMV